MESRYRQGARLHRRVGSRRPRGASRARTRRGCGPRRRGCRPGSGGDHLARSGAAARWGGGVRARHRAVKVGGCVGGGGEGDGARRAAEQGEGQPEPRDQVVRDRVREQDPVRDTRRARPSTPRAGAVAQRGARKGRRARRGASIRHRRRVRGEGRDLAGAAGRARAQDGG